MRTQIYKYSETVGSSRSAAAESFGRVGRRQPVARVHAGWRRRERNASAIGDGPFAIELHAAARRHRSRRIGDLVKSSFRFLADNARRLIAGLHSIDFQSFQPKE